MRQPRINVLRCGYPIAWWCIRKTRYFGLALGHQYVRNRVVLVPEALVSNHDGSLGRAEIAASIAEKLKVGNAKGVKLAEDIISNLTASLEAGENVKIPNFGTFMLRDKPARPGRNPKTGVEAIIPAMRVLTFRPSRELRDKVQ